MHHITEQLHDAFVESGLTVAELLRKSGLPIERSSLHRKIRGDMRLNVDEAEALAVALGVTITWPLKRAPRRRAA